MQEKKEQETITRRFEYIRIRRSWQLLNLGTLKTRTTPFIWNPNMSLRWPEQPRKIVKLKMVKTNEKKTIFTRFDETRIRRFWQSFKLEALKTLDAKLKKRTWQQLNVPKQNMITVHIFTAVMNHQDDRDDVLSIRRQEATITTYSIFQTTKKRLPKWLFAKTTRPWS